MGVAGMSQAAACSSSFCLVAKAPFFASQKNVKTLIDGRCGHVASCACSSSFCLLAKAHIFRLAEKHKNSVYWALRAWETGSGGV